MARRFAPLFRFLRNRKPGSTLRRDVTCEKDYVTNLLPFGIRR